MGQHLFCEARESVIVIHEEEQPEEPNKYSCQICQKDFKLKKFLIDHMPTHSTEKNSVCPYCKIAFKSLSNLKRHVQNSHPGKPPLLCPCGKGFFLAIHLRHHYDQVHDGKRPEPIQPKPRVRVKNRNPGGSEHRCVICCKVFRRRDTLRSHEQIHLGQKESKCLYCSYSCNQLSNLKRHVMRRHPGEPPLRCYVCGNNFFRSYELRKHLSTVHLKKYKDIKAPAPFIVAIEIPREDDEGHEVE